MNVDRNVTWKVGWGFSHRCNMRCPFCYSQAIRRRVAHSCGIERHLQFIRRNAARIESINWGTTENSLEDDWFDLVQGIHQFAPHIVQGVTTNGYLAQRCLAEPRFLEVFRTCISDVDVSLDFADDAAHAALRGHPDAYAWALRCLELCQSLDICSSIVALGIEQTLEESNLRGLFRIASRFDSNLRISLLRPTDDCGLKPPSYQQVKKALLYLVSNHAVVSLGDPLFGAIFGRPCKDPSGCLSFRILPDGSVTPATYLINGEWIAANILTEELEVSALVQRPSFLRLTADQVPPACKGCVFREECAGGCKDRRILWWKTLEQSDPYCPRRHGDNVAWGGVAIRSELAPRGKLVHDGYLPTLIFRP